MSNDFATSAISGLIREACVETPEEALEAQQRGVERIEFCARLDLDGLTPDFDTTVKLLEQLRIPLHMMIRPRAGNFDHSAVEISQMSKEIEAAKTIGVAGVVFGLTKGGELNFEAIERLAQVAMPLEVTIHKAIDTVVDPISAIERLADIEGVKYVLSSGQAATAEQGLDLLCEMEQFSRNLGINLIVCGKVTDANLGSLHDQIGASFYHGRKIVGEL